MSKNALNATTQRLARAALATLTDASITAGTLDPSRVFNDHLVILTIPSRPSSDTIAQLNPYVGFYARDIIFNTANVDLAPYNSLPFFDFLATGTLTIMNSLSFPGFSPGLYFSANQVVIAAGASINSASEFLFFGSIKSMSFDSVQIKNSAGPLEIRSDSAITLNACRLEGDLVFVNSDGRLILSGSASSILANNNISLDSANGMEVGGGSLSVSSDIGQLNLVNARGLLTVNNGAILSASFIGINSPAGVLVDSANFSGTQLEVAAGGLPGVTGGVGRLITGCGITLHSHWQRVTCP